MELLSGNISTAYILMSTPVLPLTCWYSVTCIIYPRLLMNICWFFYWCLLFDQVLTFVEVVLRPHAPLSGCHSRTPSSLSCSSSGSPAIWSVRIVKIIEVVKHEIHVFLFLSLQVMDNPLIFVHLYPDVSISLTRNSSRLDKISLELIICRRVVTPLSCGDIRDRNRNCNRVLLFLPSAHGLIVELTILFLLLIVTHVECVTTHAMITHLFLDHAVVVCGTLSKFWLLESVSSIIIVNIMGGIFRVRP